MLVSVPRQSILITGARAPVALHLGRLFHGAGWRVLLADTPAVPLSAASSACDAYVRLPPPRFEPQRYGDVVEALVKRENVTLVVPTCEEVFYLATIWRERNVTARLFAPDTDLLRRAHNKFDFIELCKSLNLAAPHTVLLQNRADLASIRSAASQLVFKPAWSRFASRVLLQPKTQEIDTLTPTAHAPWVAQEFVAGEELSVYAIAQNGRLQAFSLYSSTYRAGKGAGIFFKPIENDAAKAFVTNFAAGTAWTGQLSFDLIHKADGTVLPLECNPRATSGLHFFRNPQAFVQAICTGEGNVEPDVVRAQTVRLALWIYALPAALRAGDLRSFLRNLKGADELLEWPRDPAPKRAQWRALGEIAALALRHRISLQSASTRDIEWDGPDQSSM
ncbi:ATP-grasp domain-containing protein [Rhizobium fabae]|uniref:Putative ATP-grasp superfamily ATP-dependent carboligase n=1 Tax=Rhizobium fabae TaxID=573179 RepID=A0A7W6B8U4_9HYPH|nr:ATP-grasp domain-containing protein [Rhizobium fabae]MBB3917740.1 putative ATP-grasp superfamily ATP-dependent carboligase [Rhizobium fabae]